VVAPGSSGEWAEEFSHQEQKQRADQEFWEKLEKEWEEMAK